MSGRSCARTAKTGMTTMSTSDKTYVVTFRKTVYVDAIVLDVPPGYTAEDAARVAAHDLVDLSAREAGELDALIQEGHWQYVGVAEVDPEELTAMVVIS